MERESRERVAILTLIGLVPFKVLFYGATQCRMNLSYYVNCGGNEDLHYFDKVATQWEEAITIS